MTQYVNRSIQSNYICYDSGINCSYNMGEFMKLDELLVLLESVRFKKCMSQLKFAQLMGINQFTYMKTMNGSTQPSFVTLGKMINYLNENGYSVELER